MRETCEGEGFVSVELLFMLSVYAPCPTCHGARYNEATLKVQWNGRNIAEVPQMTVDQAHAFFAEEEAIARPLQLLQEIGLGYLRLGQPATELSGVRRNASSWPQSCSAASAGARCTCWTNPPPACMHQTPTGCWCSFSGWWTQATRW